MTSHLLGVVVVSVQLLPKSREVEKLLVENCVPILQ